MRDRARLATGNALIERRGLLPHLPGRWPDRAPGRSRPAASAVVPAKIGWPCVSSSDARCALYIVGNARGHGIELAQTGEFGQRKRSAFQRSNWVMAWPSTAKESVPSAAVARKVSAVPPARSCAAGCCPATRPRAVGGKGGGERTEPAQPFEQLVALAEQQRIAAAAACARQRGVRRR